MKTDVLILGGGVSAWAAAAEAVKAGVQVDLFCDGAGASPLIHGFCLPEGPGDSAELFYEDTVRAGCGQGDPAIIRTLTEGTEELDGYLAGLGLQPDREEGALRLLQPLGSRVPRVASVENRTGPALLRALRQRLNGNEKFTEHRGFRALELIKRDGRVTGAKLYDRAQDRFISCTAAVILLAVGGFSRLFPETTAPADLGGDGIAMAARAGASLVDMEFIQFEPCSAVAPEPLVGKSMITTMFFEGAVLRNARGERFLLKYGPEGERIQKDVLSLRMAEEILSGGAGPHGGLFFDCTAVDEARMRGVYRPYLERYLAVGIDIRKTPFEVAPAAHTALGGVRITPDCRTDVPGLFACGEVTGGLHGANRLGGNAGTETVVFGRIAGKTAAEEVKRMAEAPEGTAEAARQAEGTRQMENVPPVLPIPALRERLKTALRSGLGVLRREDRTLSALREVREMLALPFSENSFEELRFRNDLLTARLSLTAALERKGSVGCHIREDAVEEKEKYRLLLKLNGAEITVKREPVPGR